MTTPFRPAKPGGQLSARQVNQLQVLAQQAAKLTTSEPLELVRQPDGYHLRLNRPPSIWVAITGKDLDDEDATPPAFHYSGVQQLDSTDDPATTDLSTALEFMADTFPLVEINGNADLPLDGSLIVRAWIGLGGDYYTFSGGSARSDGFWAELTELPDQHNDCPEGYAWTRVEEDDTSCSGWIDYEPATEGDANGNGLPAVEVNNRLDVPLLTNDEPTRVFLRLAATGDRYTFSHASVGVPLCGTACTRASLEAEGYSVQEDVCSLTFEAIRCDPVTGTPVKTTTKICSTVPLTVGTKTAAADASSTEREFVLHPITFELDGCSVIPHYTTVTYALPDTLFIETNTY